MEREPRPNQVNPRELTGQEQNAYSRSMSEGGGGSPENVGGMSPEERVQADMAESARRVAEDDARREPLGPAVNPNQAQIDMVNELLTNPNLPGSVRRAAEEHVRQLGGEPVSSVGGSEPYVPDGSPPVVPIGSDSRPPEDGSRSRRSTSDDEPRTREEVNREVEEVAEANGLDPVADRAHILGLIAGKRAAEAAMADRASRKAESWRSMYLKEPDLELLASDYPMEWVDEKFNEIYSLADEGQELDSPSIQRIQTLFGEAAEYISYNRRENPELVQRFTGEFLGKLNLIFTRSTIEQRNLEGAQGMAQRTGARTLFKAMSFENGNVGMFFNRMQTSYDDLRLAQGKDKKILPEVEATFQKGMISSEMALAKAGVGSYGGKYEQIRLKLVKQLEEGKPSKRHGLLMDRVLEERGINLESLTEEQKAALNGEILNMEADEKIKMEITRAVRTAYDIFVITQRHAVINARGHRTGERDRDAEHWQEYLGQTGAAFASFNMENMLWEEYHLYTEHDSEFVERIKLDMAQDDIRKRLKDPNTTKAERKELMGMSHHEMAEYGKILFRDLYKVNDYFSSSWRFGGMVQQLDKYASYKGFDGKDFGLFLRLLDKDHRSDTWDKIGTYRQEEIIRLFRDRSNEDLEVKGGLYEEMRKQGIVLTDEQRAKGMTEYDVFKIKYGAVLSSIRDMEMRADIPRQIDFSNLSPEDKEKYGPIIKAALGEEGDIDKVVNIYKAMNGFIKPSGKFEGKVKNKLMYGVKFADIYQRALLADDLLLDRLEKPEEDSGLTPLSKALSPDVNTDSLARNLRDLGHAAKASEALIMFIKEEHAEERLKAAMAFAEEASMYAGQDSRAKMVRFTVGTYLNLSKKDWIWDVLNFDKGPFSRKISELQRIYGVQADAKSRIELKHELDEIKYKLVKSHGADKAEEYVDDLKGILEVNGRDINKLRMAAWLIFMIGASLLAVPAVGKESFNDLGELGVG